MAVDQASYQNFFNNINPIYANSNITASYGNQAMMMMQHQFYNLNDVGKLLPPHAVKDDSSGVTFNNNFVSRKRPRDSSGVTSGNVVPPNLLNSSSVNSTVARKDQSCGFSFLGEDFSLQLVQQQLELDRFINKHMEKMKIELEERRKQQLTRIMSTIGDTMAKKLKHKEEEIQKLNKVNLALEERVKSLYMENQIWKELAQTNEATANALRTNLEQVLHNIEHPELDNVTDDAVSCCGENDENDVVEDQGWIYCGKNEDKSKRMCRKCEEGESSVLLLPCRHLCLCTSCGPLVDVCPVCCSANDASVHVNLS